MHNRLKRILMLSPLAIIAAALLVVAVLWLFDKREAYAFDQITLHSPQSIVIAQMGAPSRMEACGAELWWGGPADSRGRNDGRCVQQALYIRAFNTWVVGYSQDHRVVSKYHPTAQ
jgi:hypothetical protein